MNRDVAGFPRNSSQQGTGYEMAGKEAVAKATDTKPDLVLMDIRLKGEIDGITTAQQIQLLEDIPIIYLTAHADPKALKRAPHSKPYGYVTKPFTAKQLHDTILQALEWQSKIRRPTCRFIGYPSSSSRFSS
jgi:CheY-like chemotaxis protein